MGPLSKTHFFRFILHAKKTGFVVEHDFIMATYLADRVIVFEGKPSVDTTAHAPQNLLNGMNRFLELLGITFRRDPNNYRPRINKINSVKVRWEKALRKILKLIVFYRFSGYGTEASRSVFLPGGLMRLIPPKYPYRRCRHSLSDKSGACLSVMARSVTFNISFLLLFDGLVAQRLINKWRFWTSKNLFTKFTLHKYN